MKLVKKTVQKIANLDVGIYSEAAQIAVSDDLCDQFFVDLIRELSDPEKKVWLTKNFGADIVDELLIVKKEFIKRSGPIQNWMVPIMILKEYFRQSGITHQQISDKTGIQRCNVTRFFALKVCPKTDMLIKITEAAGLNLNLTEQQPGNYLLATATDRVNLERSRRAELLNKISDHP
jgi:hypothetical protein